MAASTRHSGGGALWVPLLLWVVTASLHAQSAVACGLSRQQACNSYSYSYTVCVWLASAAGCWVVFLYDLCILDLTVPARCTLHRCCWGAQRRTAGGSCSQRLTRREMRAAPRGPPIRARVRQQMPRRRLQ